MAKKFSNVYDDKIRADAYARLGFPGTYYLAFRDLPTIIANHVGGGRALDFGCGAGRSTRFLYKLGFDVIGVDISEHMITEARKIDPEGDYRVVEDGGLGGMQLGVFDLVLSAFTFDNIATMEKKVSLLKSLEQSLSGGGRLINLVSNPEIYRNEWASFSTRAFPENRTARSGDRVKIEMLDVEDRRPVEDILWTDEDYRKAYEAAGLNVLEAHRPLASTEEEFPWVSEMRIAAWVIYVLGSR